MGFIGFSSLNADAYSNDADTREDIYYLAAAGLCDTDDVAWCGMLYLVMSIY